MAQPDPALRQEGGDVKAGVGVLLATCISTLVVNANTSAVSILLPSISEDTGASINVLQWAVTGYSLVGAAFIVTSGALGDVFGRRKVFLGGLFLFMASCVLIALSTSEWGVIGGRAIQGAAGSTILACGMSLLTVASTGAERLRAVSLWGAASAIGAAVGPLVGGVLVGTAGWQTLFWITFVVAGLCVPLTLSGVEESMDPDRSRNIDWAGTFLVAAILAPLILALSKGADWGWGSLATIGSLVVSIASAIAFVYVEKRSEAPLVDLGLLRNRVLIGATLGILIGAGTINGLMFLLSIYFQEPATLGMTALEAGLATLPAAAGMVILAPLVPKIASKIGTRQAVGLGFIIMTAGFAVLIATEADWAYSLFVLPIVAIAAGMALSNGPCSSASTSAVPERQVGSASGISNMARYVGASVWTAVVAAIYSSVTADRAASGAGDGESLAAALGAACVFLTITSALGILLAWLAGRHRPPAPLPVDLAASAAASVHTIEIPHPESPERVRALGTA